MAADKIRILIVDDIAETRENILKLLQFELDVDVVGADHLGRKVFSGTELVSGCYIDGYQYAGY